LLGTPATATTQRTSVSRPLNVSQYVPYTLPHGTRVFGSFAYWPVSMLLLSLLCSALLCSALSPPAAAGCMDRQSQVASQGTGDVAEAIMRPMREVNVSEATISLAWVPNQPSCLATGTGVPCSASISERDLAKGRKDSPIVSQRRRQVASHLRHARVGPEGRHVIGSCTLQGSAWAFLRSLPRQASFNVFRGRYQAQAIRHWRCVCRLTNVVQGWSRYGTCASCGIRCSH